MWKPHWSGCISTKRLACLGVVGAPTAGVNISVLDAAPQDAVLRRSQVWRRDTPGRDAGHLNLPVDVRFFANNCRKDSRVLAVYLILRERLTTLWEGTDVAGRTPPC
jgi:hypothetical protein